MVAHLSGRERKPRDRTPPAYASTLIAYATWRDAIEPHPAPWPPCATSPSDSYAKQAGPTSPPQLITTGHAPSTQQTCSDSQPENASPLTAAHLRRWLDSLSGH